MNRNIEIKKSNELISTRKRKIVVKRSILLFILLSAMLCTLCLKLPYFNIYEIRTVNNRNIDGNEIIKLSGILTGNNIFYINVRKVKANILSNPYISDVKVKRELPNKITLSVSERDAVFYIEKNGKYAVLDQNSVLLENRKNIEKMDLVKVDGVEVGSSELGQKVQEEDQRRLETLKVLADLIKRNTSDIKISAIDVKDMLNINIYVSQMCIKMGSNYNMEDKLNKALNIIENEKISNAKGYVDVSFKGNPVFYVEK